MKKIFLSLLLLFWASFAFATENEKPKNNDKEKSTITPTVNEEVKVNAVAEEISMPKTKEVINKKQVAKVSVTECFALSCGQYCFNLDQGLSDGASVVVYVALDYLICDNWPGWPW